MHRTFNVSVPATRTDSLIAQLQGMPTVIGLGVARGKSIKPAGDELTLTVLNLGADEVISCVATSCQGLAYSIATSELDSLIDPMNHAIIEEDHDESIWEEMETGLRHSGKVTQNYLALMSIGGMLATVGLVSDPAHQAVSFVAAAVLAPGFDPLAKVALGTLHRNSKLVRSSLRSFVLGYLALIVTAGLSFWLLLSTGAATIADFTGNPEVESLSHPKMKQFMLSLGGALAGGIIVASYRQSFIAGALMALAIIHAAAMIGMSIVIGDWQLAWQGTERVGLDILFVIGGCLVVFAVKQWTVHHRKPVV